MSPSGIDAFQKHSSAIAARRGSGEYQRVDYFKIEDGESARVRFLEQGENLTWALSHRIKTSGLTWPQDVLCLDQEDEGTSCPACQSDNKEIRSRSTKGYVCLIWRGSEESQYSRSPVYKKNDKGFVEKVNGQKVIIGYEDAIWVWKCNKRTFEQILAKDKTYKGIMSRDFTISRQGADKDNTMYFIEPAVVDGGPEPMAVVDQNLAHSKFDIIKLTTPGTYDEMVQLLSDQNSAQNSKFQFHGKYQEEPTQENVFNTGAPMRSSAFQR